MDELDGRLVDDPLDAFCGVRREEKEEREAETYRNEKGSTVILAKISLTLCILRARSVFPSPLWGAAVLFAVHSDTENLSS